MLVSLFEIFIKEKRFLANLSEKTLHSYKQVFDRYKKFSDVSAIPDEAKLNAFVMGMREHGLSITTCNISIRSFNSFLSWLKDKGHIEELRIKKLKEEKKVMRTMNDAQLKAILNWKPQTRAEHRLHTLACFLIDTGVRINEALTLTNERVDYDNLLVTVTGKGNKQRIIPISIELRKIMYRYSTKHKYSRFPTEWFFASSTGTQLGYHNTYRDLKRVLKACGIEHKDFDGYFHNLRRKFAKSYVKNGGNLFYLQKVLGHGSIATTKLYVEVETEDLQNTHLKTSPLSRLR